MYYSKLFGNKLLSFLFILLCVFLLPNHAYAKLVKVGVYSNKPLVFKDQQGMFQGLSIDILQYIAVQEGWELQFVEGSWPESLKRLEAGQIDLQVAIAISDDRKQLYNYSEQALITNWGKLYRHPDTKVSSIQGLKGKTVALVENDIHSIVFADWIARFNINLTTVLVDSYDGVLKRVASGEVDTGVVSRLYAMQNQALFQVQETPMVFNPIDVHYAAPNGENNDLIQAIDQHLKALRKENNSLYYQSLDKWFTAEDDNLVPPWVRPALIVVSGLLSLIIFVSFFLKRQVAVKTRDLQTLFETSHAAIFIHDMDGRALKVNETMLGMFDVDSEDALSLSIIDDYSSPRNPLKRVAVYWKRVIAGAPQQFEWIARRPHDGSCFMVQVNMEKIQYFGSDAVFISVQDISREREATEKLASSEEWLSVTLRSIGEGVITTDTDGKIILVNQAAEELTGWSQQEATHKPLQEIFTVTDDKTEEPRGNPGKIVLASGQVIRQQKHSILIARDGSQKNITDSAAPIFDKAQNIIGAVLVFRDTSAQKRAEDERKRLDKLNSVGILAGGIAHDFNNILGAILSNIELATFHTSSKNEAHRQLLEAKTATIRAKDLTGQLLTFAKGGEPVTKTASLDTVITDSARFVLHGSAIQCNYRIPDGLWQVTIDTGQISRVIQNLVINARQAMPEGGAIDISCENISDISPVTQILPDGKYVRLCIADSGIGISEKYLDKIFDPYFSTKNEGSGLGLASCFSIIKNHHGWITVDSSVGNGTTFSVYLPASIQADGKERETNSARNMIAQSSRKATILVMDDDAMIRDATKQLLTKAGHDVVLAKDGREAIGIYSKRIETKHFIDILIMDLTIPDGMSGKKCIAEILRLNPKAKAVVVSGYSNDPVMAHYQDYGFSASIAKPFEFAELDKIINDLI